MSSLQSENGRRASLTSSPTLDLVQVEGRTCYICVTSKRFTCNPRCPLTRLGAASKELASAKLYEIIVFVPKKNEDDSSELTRLSRPFYTESQDVRPVP